jgi:hypothetical protein
MRLLAVQAISKMAFDISNRVGGYYILFEELSPYDSIISANWVLI